MTEPVLLVSCLVYFLFSISLPSLISIILPLHVCTTERHRKDEEEEEEEDYALLISNRETPS